MTRDEIDELIEYLEKNYHVKCLYVPPKDEFDLGELRCQSTMSITFRNEKLFDKEIIANELYKRDLIRF